jgi:hypothetical protein
MDVADRIPSRIGQQDNRADDGANAKTMQKGSRFCEYGLGHSPSLSWVNLAVSFKGSYVSTDCIL